MEHPFSTQHSALSTCLCIMGPTASGKTTLAERIAGELPVELVSVDSALVYRGMDIGTAKPATPHRLVDILDPREPYSAARFRDDALREIADIHAAGRIPLLVGGTMLYFRALLDGLSDLPAADLDVRARIEARARREGWEALHTELARIDPDAAARIHPNDPQRIQRALEVYEITGRPISELQLKNRRSQIGSHKEQIGFHGVEFRKLAVAPEDRAELHRRIAARFEQMVADGLVDEVRALRARCDLGPELPSMRAVGYRQIWAFLDGECTLDEAKARAVHATRQLAKRQLTWLRREPDATWLASDRIGWLEEGVRWARMVL